MIVILCPAKTTTGGAELMHQIAHSLGEMQVKNIILYKGEESIDSIRYFRRFYKYQYTFEMESINQLKTASVLAPETMISELKYFTKGCRKMILWASINNYFRIKDTNSFARNLLNIIKQLIGFKEISFLKLRHFEHFHQSFYAQAFLSRFRYKSEPVGDYLNDLILEHAESSISKKENIILYNPKKGHAKAIKLIKYLKNAQFVPLINLSKEELINYLKKAKIYIDFGLHPGKDRIPREAALYNCIIVTSRFGSARNDMDIKIPSIFKYGRFVSSKSIAADLSYYLENYSQVIEEFEDYRISIKKEKVDFQNNLRNIFYK